MDLPDLYTFRTGKSLFHRRVKDIDYVKGEGSCTGFHFEDGSELVEDKHIGWHWKHLQGFQFFMKIHRSFIVNLKAIRGTTPKGTVLLKSGTELLCASNSLPVLLKLFPIVGQ